MAKFLNVPYRNPEMEKALKAQARANGRSAAREASMILQRSLLLRRAAKGSRK